MSAPFDLDAITLASGAHDRRTDGVCVMEAVAWWAGEDHSDRPECVSPVIGAFLRSWNDALPDGDRQQLRRWIPEVVGTNAGPAVDAELSWIALDWLVRVHTPAWLRLAGLAAQADVLAGMAEVTPTTCPSILPTLTAVCSDARAAAWAAARAAARTAAGDAARTAAGDAARAAAWAAARAAARDAAWIAAGAAAWDAARAAAWIAAWAATGAAARDAARDALAPTVAELQVSAHDLIGLMVAHAKARVAS